MVVEAAWGSGDAHIPSSAMHQPGLKVIGAHNASPLPFGFASKPSPSALGPGATIGVLGTRVPRLACLRPTAWLHRRPRTDHLRDHQDKTLERQATPRPSEEAATPCGLLRSGDFYAGAQPHEVAVTQAMTIKARRVPAGADEAVSYLVQRRQAQA